MKYEFDDQYWDEDDPYSVFCRVYWGSDSLDTAPITGNILYCDDPITVTISGDNWVCVDDYGYWSASVSGGSGDYMCEWYIDDESLFMDQNPIDFYFDSEYGNPPQYVDIDLEVYDNCTWNYGVAQTFQVYLSPCSEFGLSAEVSPNPASDYINITVTENKSDYGFSPDNKISDENANKEIDETLTYILVDNYGRKLYEKITSEKTLTISVSGYLPGTYNLKILWSKGSIDKQVIIAH